MVKSSTKFDKATRGTGQLHFFVMHEVVMDIERMNAEVDSVAMLGFRYAEGTAEIPFDVLDSTFKIDCFNAGIMNYNSRYSTFVSPILEGMKSTYIQGANNGCTDKELAIVGA